MYKGENLAYGIIAVYNATDESVSIVHKTETLARREYHSEVGLAARHAYQSIKTLKARISAEAADLDAAKDVVRNWANGGRAKRRNVLDKIRRTIYIDRDLDDKVLAERLGQNLTISEAYEAHVRAGFAEEI